MTDGNPTFKNDGVLRTKLANGAVLLVKEDHSTPVVSLNLWVEAGSIDENPDERGMAHLIEHMIFKGTEERGVGEISRQVEAAGGYLNAFTSFEHTCFYVVLPSSQFEKAIEIEFDAYLHSTFDAAELSKEKEVVFEEMRMRQDDPWSWSWELLFNILFDQNPYHWPVIGDMKILREVPREKLLAYYKTHYVPSNTVITVVGDLQGEKAVKWVRDHFEKVVGPPPPPRHFSADPEPRSLRLKVEPGEVQQAYLSIGFPTVPLSHADSAPLEILAAVLGDGAASRLNLSLREKTQSVDDVAAETFSGKYGGAMVFQGLTDMARVEKCVLEMMAEVQKIIRTGVPEEELLKVKNKIKASKVFEKQNMDGQAKNLGFWELLGDFQLEEKYLMELDGVTSEDLKRIAAQYLKPHRASVVLYHPKTQKAIQDAAHWQALLQKGWDSAGVKARPVQARGGGLQRFRLKNGSTLLVKERRNLPLVSLGAFLPGGFSEETASRQGLTMLLTKCLQKGTARKNHEQFSNELESYAAHLDASMEKDYWGLTLDVLKPNFEKAFGLMWETLYEPGFDPVEVNKEKKMQVSAIERLKDDPAEFALLESDVLTFAGTPYAHRPMGTVEVIRGISEQDIRRWHQRHLEGPLTWVAVGDFDAAELKAFLDSRLPPAGKARKGQNPKAKEPVLKPRNLEIPNESQQANLVLGFRAPSFHSPEYFTFRVLNTLLNGMGGRLFIELREKKSLAYSVFASHDSATSAGIYQIYIGCAPAKVEEAKKGLAEVLRSFVAGPVSNEELKRAKAYMVGLYQMGLQANRSQVHSYARYDLSGKGADLVEKFPQLIEKVTAEDVRRIAKKYINTDRRTWVLLTPKGKKTKKR